MHARLSFPKCGTHRGEMHQSTQRNVAGMPAPLVTASRGVQTCTPDLRYPTGRKAIPPRSIKIQLVEEGLPAVVSKSPPFQHVPTRQTKIQTGYKDPATQKRLKRYGQQTNLPPCRLAVFLGPREEWPQVDGLSGGDFVRTASLEQSCTTRGALVERTVVRSQSPMHPKLHPD